jgi:hypothetical protein
VPVSEIQPYNFGRCRGFPERDEAMTRAEMEYVIRSRLTASRNYCRGNKLEGEA